MEKLLKIQFYVLFAGTVFAWGNFCHELFDWLNAKPWQGCVAKLSCPVYGPNPFLTSCFFGTVFFTMAFILNILIKKQQKA
ncbi:MAG: hypothetical protein A2418_01190 [Candidatus Brennerbacteria bacterium RIFOXYC1_FULL_41_11]|uniref:Uncharacterized protein n=1 Tax=Candidatus Brennerbacteria bacterium RIFOXYD1_FULL_41_16 TaxID=1797529 RepID=A0A1G1XL78_9BACT|nr:MAG: hypothetical protein A2418_01190 [Candidatus Brennerbacteria bacterium RIFOXYC1_FULL_41_11]OGY40436.1 MAG: hypothetical protein A2570_01840 [Candidatus Brennerbacteria bacterium RIFOXYD1_FULL_41_16]